MSEGIYTINYTGIAGMGSVVLVFYKGEIYGVDVMGSAYHGSYHENATSLSGQINLEVPPGVSLVTGAPVVDQAYVVPIPFSLPLPIRDNETVQIRVTLPSGPVNANVKKVKSISSL